MGEVPILGSATPSPGATHSGEAQRIPLLKDARQLDAVNRAMSQTFSSTRQVLLPPNPKELETATRTGCWRAVLGT